MIRALPPKPEVKYVRQVTCHGCKHVLLYEKSDVMGTQWEACERGCCTRDNFHIICPKCKDTVTVSDRDKIVPLPSDVT